MGTIAMCFSLLQLPRCRIHSLANSCLDSFYRLGRDRVRGSRYRCKIICSNFDPEGGYIKKYSARNLSAKTGENNESVINRAGATHEIIPETRTQIDSCGPGTGRVQKSRKVSIRSKIISQSTCSSLTSNESESDQYYTDLAKHATVFCFDIETTGFNHPSHRIIEIAFQDLRGGENSTLQTLINPERDVTNEHFHGISASMVMENDVPRMKDFIPIFLHYVRSRQIPGGIVIFVSHNGRTFDVPFLKREFSRCGYDVPEHWYFVDTMDLARMHMNSKGKEDRSKINLQSLREYFNIPLIGEPHRALSDVHTLALVFQRLTNVLKLSLPGVIKTSFK